MIKPTPKFLILPLLLLAFTVKAQVNTDTLKLNSLDEMLGLAIKNNPTQAVYQQQVQQAIYNRRAAAGLLYPNASAGFAGTDNLHLAVTPIPGELLGKPGTTFYAQFGKKFVYGSGITLGENLFDWQSVLQTEIAGSNVKLSRIQQDYYVQTLKEQAARLYFSALIAKASLKIINTDQLLADSLVDLSKQRLQQGTTDAISVNQAVINANNVQQNRAQSQQLYDQSIENLKIILGAKATGELVIMQTARLDSLTYNGLIQLGADRSLDVYREQVEVAALQSKSQRSVAYPTIGATAYFGAQQFQNDFALSFANNAWSGYRYLGLNINVPIFTGLSNSNKYKSALVQQDIAQLQYDNAKQQSEINDRLLVKNYHDYRDMVVAANNNFKLYFNNLQLNRQKYQEGISNMDVYLKAFQDYLTAENTYLNDLSQLLSTKSTIISRQ